MQILPQLIDFLIADRHVILEVQQVTRLHNLIQKPNAMLTETVVNKN